MVSIPSISSAPLATPPDDTICEPSTRLPTAEPPANTVCDAA
jgi:hypothetical protein